MQVESAPTGVYHANVAGFPAVRAIVLAIHAEANPLQPLAISTVTIARTLLLGLVALDAKYGAGCSHAEPLGRLYSRLPAGTSHN